MSSSEPELGWVDIVALVFGALMVWLTVNAVNNHNDFVAFYEVAKAWRLHTAVSQTGPLDLNPPTFSVLISPLTLLSLNAARFTWTVIGFAALVDSLRRIRVRLKLRARATLRLAIACVALQPAVFAWALGQLTWVLMWLVTRAWLDAERPGRSGAWLGISIAIKPPLALMALLLTAPVLLIAGTLAAVITSAAVALTGIEPWRAWLHASREVDWLQLRPNASLWGLAARVESRHIQNVHLADIPAYAICVILGLGLLLALMTLRSVGPRRWLFAGLWSVTMSPLGWTYYLPVMIGPAAASSVSSPPALIGAVVCLAAPITVFYHLTAATAVGQALAGSIYSIALGLLWWAWWLPPASHPHSDEPSSPSLPPRGEARGVSSRQPPQLFRVR